MRRRNPELPTAGSLAKEGVPRVMHVTHAEPEAAGCLPYVLPDTS